MNPHRRCIRVDNVWVERGRAFGHEIVRYYANEGRFSPSRSRSGDRGAESDPVRQGIGKVGECAVAILFNLDPEAAIKWTTGRADAGHDVTFGDKQFDVKATESWKRFLVWSRDVNDLYHSKVFTHLVSVSVDQDDWSNCWVEGQVSKHGFFARKAIADGYSVGRGLEPGTWHMHKADLDDIADLLVPMRPMVCPCCRGRGFIRGVEPGFEEKPWGQISVTFETIGPCEACNGGRR